MYSQALTSIFGNQSLQNSEMRLAIVKQMCELASSENVNDSELKIVHRVFDEFCNDIWVQIRIEIAKSVCQNDFFSRHLVLKLAEGAASYAQYVLCYSKKLSSVDLIEHILTADQAKQLAIANRYKLPNDVVLALIEHGTLEVVQDLIRNSSAKLDAHNLRQLYINFNTQPQIRELLTNRTDLPADLRELIAFDLSKQLETFAIDANWLNHKQASNVAKKSYEITVIDISTNLNDVDMTAYIHQLSEGERLTSSLILRSITTGYMNFFEHALAYLANIPITKLHSLLHNPNLSTRQALFSRSKLPADIHPILALSIDIYSGIKQEFAQTKNPDKQEFSIKMIKNVAECYHSQQGENQAYLQRVLDCYYIDISHHIAA